MSTTAPDSGSLLLPPGAVLLHVGPYKTGSSAIQRALHEARPRLPEHGVLYPGSGPRARRAGWAVLDAKVRGRAAPHIREWEAYVDEVRRAGDMRVCVSNEDFGRSGPSYASRIVDDLGCDRVHVVVAARRYDKLLPSQWQERVKNFATVTYDEFLREVLSYPDSEDPVAKAFWASHGPGPVERWASVVGPDRVSVVVIDSADPGRMARAFEQMLGLPEGLLVTRSDGNVSLPTSGTELVRRMNARFEQNGWSDVAYDEIVRKALVSALRHAPHTPEQARPPMPASAVQGLVERSEEQVRRLRDLGVRVVGDPDSLLVPVDIPTGDPQAPALLEVSMDFAEEAVAGAVAGGIRLGDRQRRARARRRRAVEKKRAAGRSNGRPKASAAAPDSRVVDAPTSDLVRELAHRVVRRSTRRTTS